MPLEPLAALGSHSASIKMSWFGPGTIVTLRAVAWPISVPLLRSRIFTYGTTAEYSVGFVILTLASIERLDFVVSIICKDPTSGVKPFRSPPDIARSQTISTRNAVNATIHSFQLED